MVEIFDCDKCGRPGQRHVHIFPDGTRKTFDRCDKHDRRLEALREEAGTWGMPPRRNAYRVKTMDELQEEREG